MRNAEGEGIDWDHVTRLVWQDNTYTPIDAAEVVIVGETRTRLDYREAGTDQWHRTRLVHVARVVRDDDVEKEPAPIVKQPKVMGRVRKVDAPPEPTYTPGRNPIKRKVQA